uniref:C2 domain-containing protein n=1 Tax=Phaeomonas parva TaxID=124430 RepID=A0A6U4H7X1_9STRA|mmetsp:Transcript_3250/g.9441  ORF Transcript_3250/g.9441 Transcript_3250/m.9441 type:complete len:406 (+) Transcript_3250:135-1352(+)
MVMEAALSPQGSVIVRAEEKVDCGVHAKVQLRGHDLAKMDGLRIFAKSDPYFVLSRANEDGSWTPVHRTDFVEGTVDPVWPLVCLSAQRTCNGDLVRPLKIEVFDHDNNNDDDPMGEVMTSLQDLGESDPSRTWPVMLDGEQKGTLSPLDTPAPEIFNIPTFVDYLHGGLELNVIVGIDFTASNGDPQKPGTLHYVQEGAENQYETALRCLLDILSEYDTDQEYPVYGFGAKPDGGSVQHCFPVGGHAPKKGTQGVLEAYRQCLAEGLQLSGPPLFNPIMEAALAKANSDKENGRNTYTILVVLCDGSFTDIHNCLDTLLAAATSPLSVILIGVGEMRALSSAPGPPPPISPTHNPLSPCLSAGDEDFSEMSKLDGDDGRLKSFTTGELCPRDLVQFVKVRRLGG